MAPKIPPQEILEKRAFDTLISDKTVPFDLGKLSNELEHAQNAQNVFHTVSLSLEKLAPRERAFAQKNLQRLAEIMGSRDASIDAHKGLRAQIESVRQEIGAQPTMPAEIDAVAAPTTTPAATPAPPAAPTTPEKKTILDSIKQTAVDIKKDFVESGPWTKAGYIAGGVVGFLALRWLWRKTFGDPKEHKEGFVKKSFKWLLGIGATVAGVLGVKALIDYTSHALSLRGAADKAKDEIDALRQQVSDIELKDEPWKKYGIDEETFERAEETYRSKILLSPSKKEEGMEEMRALFAAAGATPEQFEKFMEDMDYKYEVRTLEEAPHIRYVRPTVALSNYQKNVEVVVSQFVQILKNNAVEAAAIAYIAHRMGIDKALLTTTKLTAAQSLGVAKGIGKIGIRHPVISLVLLGGSALTLSHLISKRKDGEYFLPENINQLLQACNENREIILGNIGDALKDEIADMQQHASNVGLIGGDYIEWVTSNVADFTSKLIHEIGPEAIGLTEQEISGQRNVACIEELQHWVSSNLAMLTTSSGNEEEIQKHEQAIERINAFREAYERERATLFTNSNEPQQLFTELTNALRDIGIDIAIKDGIVQWKTGDMDDWLDVCVDPSISDERTFHELSERLYSGEGIATFMFEQGLQKLRQLEQEGVEKIGIPNGSKCLAMVMGNFVYFIELDWKQGFIDWDNVEEYGMAPIECITEFFDTDETWAEWGATLSAGAVTTAMFSLNAKVFTTVKRLAIGGGPLINPKHGLFKKNWNAFRRLGAKVTPGIAHIDLMKNIYHGANDFTLIGKELADARSLVQIPAKWWRGRYLNTILSRAGIRPQWIPIIEHGSFNDLNAIWGKMGNRKADANVPLENFRKTVKEEVLERLNLAPRREITLKNFGSRMLRAGHGGDAEGIYNEIVRLWDKTSASGSASGSPVRSISISAAAPNAQSSARSAPTSNPVVEEQPKLKIFNPDEAAEASSEVKSVLQQADEAMELPHGPVRAAAIEEVLESPALARAAASAPKSNAAAIHKTASLLKNSKLALSGIGLGLAIDIAFIVENHKQLSEAVQKGDEATASILRARQESLINGGIGGVAVGGLAIAGSTLAGPLGLVLMGGTITSEMLYSYAQKLNTDDAEYMKRDPADLLKELRDLPFPSWSEEIAGTIAGNKEDVKKNKWLSLCRAYLMKTNASVVQLTNADRREADRLFHEEASPQKKTELLAQHGSEGAAINALLQEVAYNRLVLLMHKQVEFLFTRGNVTGALDFRRAESFAKMYELRRSFEDAKRAPVITYLAGEAKPETLDLSTLPALNELPPRNASAAWNSIKKTLEQYERYDIARTRSEFLALTENVDGNAASNFLQVKLLQRMQHTIIVSEAKVQKAFAAPLDMDVSGGLFDFQANVVRYELRKKIMMNINAMATHIMNKSTDLDIVMERFAIYENTLNALDMKTVFDETPGEHDNPLKHALASASQLTMGQTVQIELLEGSGSVARMRKEAAIAGQKAIEKEIGVPLEQALTSLLSPRVS